jgi:hypothetical protein
VERGDGAENPDDLAVVAIVMVADVLPTGIDGGLKVIVAPAGLPAAENVVAFSVAIPPGVVRLIVKLAG